MSWRTGTWLRQPKSNHFVADFLKDTWYKPTFEINTSGRADLVIHVYGLTKEEIALIEQGMPGGE